MAKSWTDMRAEVTRLQQQAAQKAPADPNNADPNAATPKEEPPKEDPADRQKQPEKSPDERLDDQIQNIAKAENIDLNPFIQEYSTTGDVSEEGRKALAEKFGKAIKGDARQFVDDFIEARKIVHQRDQAMYTDAAGGEQAYGEMVKWASASLPPEQVAAYNKTVTSGDRHATLLAIEGLRAKFEQANGRLPTLRQGSTGFSNTGGYKSTYEMVQAMQDPRYQKDPVYRDEVKAKLAASNF
jgi:hypothetical protein